jgi:shikimate dehydrogenase
MTGNGITPGTRLFLLLGHPVASSLSPLIQNGAFRALALDARYHCMDIMPGRFSVVFSSLLEAGISGNITAPYKEDSLDFIDLPTSQALATRACNVFWCRHGRSYGDNTDIHGFLDSLPSGIRRGIDESSAVILGAGGTARSIVAALLLEGLERLLIVNRDEARAKTLAHYMRFLFPGRDISSCAYESLGRFRGEPYRILINATPLGWRDDESPPVDPGDFPGLEFYFDVVYGRKTVMMRRCESSGIETMGGLDMLVYQGARSFERWFEIEAPLDVMLRSAGIDAEGEGKGC